MNSIQRKKTILTILKEKGFVSVEEISNTLDVSVVTVRKDFSEMKDNGLLLRTRGGAALPEDYNIVRKIENTIHEQESQKDDIAKVAASLIKPGQNIFIDSGSTTSFLVRYIKDMDISVLTNSLIVAYELSHSKTVDVTLTGGILRKASMGIMGQLTEQFIEGIYVDIVFIGSATFSPHKGIYCTNFMESAMKSKLLHCGDRTVLLADSSKTDKKSLCKIDDWSNVDTLITDSMSEEYKMILNQKGTEVLLSS